MARIRWSVVLAGALMAGPSAAPVPPFPPVGLAVRDSTSAWCAAFPADSAASALATGLAPGEPITIVFVGTARAPSVSAAVAIRRSAPCPAAFPQPRWEGYVAYDLVLPDSHRLAAAEAPGVALAVASTAPWVRGADGRLRADLDGDGVLEEARRCAADEGEHFTLWSPTGQGGAWRRRAHEYYDWGVLVEPSCRPGEDGRLAIGAPAS